MSAVIRWVHGGDARVLSIDTHAIVLCSTVPSPPGARIEGTLADQPPVRLRAARRTAATAYATARTASATALAR